MTIPIAGFNIKPEKPDEGACSLRVYGTREASTLAGGEVVPAGTWELVTELKLKRARGRCVLPDFELEPTGEGGWRFYNVVNVGRDGRETWHAGEHVVLPPDLPQKLERLGAPLDYPRWILWNLEQRGVIAPGQLND